MLSKIHKWLKDLLAPGWDSPKPELKYHYDFETGIIKLDMDSFRNSEVVQAQIAACRLQNKTSVNAPVKSRRNNTRRRRVKRPRSECPTTMHNL